MTTVIVSNPVLRRRDIPRALFRFWAWQFWRHAVRTPVLARMGDGCVLSFPPFTQLAGTILATGWHEPREQLFAAALLADADVAVDVGAHLGTYSTLMAATGAHVFAVEPSSRARAALSENIRINPQCRITVIPAALSDRPGVVGLTIGLDVTNHLVAEDQDVLSEPVDVNTLDALTEGPSATIKGSVVLIKIDAEGSDDRVIQGGEHTIIRDKPVLIIETWGTPTTRHWLEDRGYSVYLYEFRDRQLVEYPRDWDRQANLIAVHDDEIERVRSRLAQAHPHRPGLPELAWRRKARRRRLETWTGAVGRR